MFKKFRSDWETNTKVTPVQTTETLNLKEFKLRLELLDGKFVRGSVTQVTEAEYSYLLNSRDRVIHFRSKEELERLSGALVSALERIK